MLMIRVKNKFIDFVIRSFAFIIIIADDIVGEGENNKRGRCLKPIVF